MRPELMPHYADRSACRDLVERAFEAIEARRAPADERAAIERLTGRRISGDELHAWYESASADEVAAELTLPKTLRVDDITKDELVEIVRRLKPGDPLFDPANEAYWSALFEANTPRPDAVDLIYYPPEGHRADEPWDPRPEEVVELALSCRPIEL